jgi:hypothetical protein
MGIGSDRFPTVVSYRHTTTMPGRKASNNANKSAGPAPSVEELERQLAAARQRVAEEAQRQREREAAAERARVAAASREREAEDARQRRRVEVALSHRRSASPETPRSAAAR